MKRYLNKILLMTAVAGGLCMLGACLKNNEYYVDFSKYKPSMELPLAATTLNGPVPVPLGVEQALDTFHVVVNVASVDPLKTAQTATIALDPDYMAQYNSDQDAATKAAQQKYLDDDTSHTVDDENYPPDYVPYEMFPDSLYTIDKMDLTVPAGERQDFAILSVNARGINTDHNYVLPFTITKSSLNISSWNHLMLNIQQKNPYDADYTNTYSGDLGSGENTQTLKTVDPNTCSTALIGMYPGNPMTIYVDPNTYKVTIGGSGVGAAATDPSSHYDPATKTFYLDYTIFGGAYHIVQKLVRK